MWVKLSTFLTVYRKIKRPSFCQYDKHCHQAKVIPNIFPTTVHCRKRQIKLHVPSELVLLVFLNCRCDSWERQEMDI